MSSEPPQNPAGPPPAAPRRNLRRRVVAGLLAAAAVAGGAYLWHQHRTADRRDGLAAAANGDFERAEPLLKRALVRDPGDAEVVAVLARRAVKIDDPEGAEAHLSKWIALRPDDPEPRKLRMEFYRKQKRPEGAYPDALKLLALEPDPALRRRVMGMAFSAGDFATAQELCDACAREAPGDLGVLQMQAEIHRARGRPADAAALLDQVLARPSPPPGMVLTRALLYEEAGQPEKAVPLLRAVFDNQKAYRRTAGTRLAVALERTGRAEEARAVMQEVRRLQEVEVFGDAVKTQPNNLELHVQLAERLLAGGHTQDALALLDTVLAADPGFRPAHAALAAHYEKSGAPARAAEHRARATAP